MKRITRTCIIALVFVFLFSPAVQAAVLGSRTLKTGMRGEDVSKLQQLLKNIGYFNTDDDYIKLRQVLEYIYESSYE